MRRMRAITKSTTEKLFPNTPTLEETPLDEEAREVIGVAALGLDAKKPPDETRVLEAVPRRFAAFTHPNFRLFWLGNLFSLVGTWAQQTAQGWLMRTLTPDPFLITGVAACGSLPILLLTLYTGAVADRVDKRRLLLLTNICAMILATFLGVLVFTKIVAVWHIALIAICLGIVNAFDIPTRQSFNMELVGRRDLPNAIALNSSAFNAARVLGPTSGGWLLNNVGIAGCFFVNAASFLALIFGLTRMSFRRCPPNEATDNEKADDDVTSSTRSSGCDDLNDEPCLPDEEVQRRALRREDILQGFYFVRRHAVLWPVVMLVALVSLFAMSFSSLLPVFAKDVFDSDQNGYSQLMTWNGVGALGSAVALAIAGSMRHKGKRLLLGALLFCVSVELFAFAPTLFSACGALVLVGWFLLTFLTTANTLVQTAAPDELRGRVFSLYSLALIGTSPLGAGLIGLMAKYFGPREAVALGASAAALCCIGIFLFYRDLWKER